MALPTPRTKCWEFSWINLNVLYHPAEAAVAPKANWNVWSLAFLHLGGLKRCFRAQLMKCWVTESKDWHERVGVPLFVFCFPFPEICQHSCYIWIQTELSALHYVISCFIAILFKVCVSPTAYFQFIIDALFTHIAEIYEYKCWNTSVIVA